MDFTYGIGSIVGPLAASPFLVEIPDLQMELEFEDIPIGSLNASLLNNSYSQNKTIHFVTAKDMKLVYPYTMVASFMGITFLTCAILYLFEPQDVPHPSRLEDETGNVDSNKNDGITDGRQFRKPGIETNGGQLCLRGSSLPNIETMEEKSEAKKALDFGVNSLNTPRTSDQKLADFKPAINNLNAIKSSKSSDTKVLNWTQDLEDHKTNEDRRRTRTVGGQWAFKSGKTPVKKMASFPTMSDRRKRLSTTPSILYTIKKASISKVTKVSIIIITSLIYAFVNGMGMIEAGFLTSYVHESHFKLDMKVGATMESSSWITHIVSGIISIYVVKKFGLKLNLIIGVSVVLISNIFLVIMTKVSSSEWIMWVGITGISIGGCSFFSSLVSFMESIFPVSSRVASLYLVPNCLSNIIWPQIVGHLIEVEPQVFIYSMAFCAIASALLLTSLLAITGKIEKSKNTTSIVLSGKIEKSKNTTSIVV